MRSAIALMRSAIVVLPLLLWLVGCAPPAPGARAQEDAWSGRIALQVQAQAQAQGEGQGQGQAAQAFSAMFELHGNADSGGLVLLNPLGQRLAQLDWKDGHAQLHSGQETRSSDSLDALLQDLTGAGTIPVAALFSWLKGIQATATGWQADLSGIADGRISARRDDPAATLRIALTR
ncbi:lipoprotein insertase outer membrane protein LolB [Verminephrobacter eiseniae]|uniref:lipoprotein insertase outer membrane protein LolB n=1 Tax=Verminephrobacter eiseniae TaxID=364317 RepID=UPI0010E3B8BB|nr:lipoprotein insertase outer membrane protein LolB [Verminephrobacter eiseniae]KAB7632545.1 outer membrane lipoprotein LolB [Verminephrobacter sp. Larva24]MCW5294641.1 outer membrane lipoprotein LolB [Verminephrobacter eiseniae]MCW8185695.1 outer membrane lipoprotein LolB [Verminephrobacter eiseniae]MCW8224377.1 outer membrane lipoprotein LolB [Verminephrobacter eiseniae]MCW8235505.1 outer membrane lipoprotein LolB [Verminephrobacter eiseniae]